MYEGEIVKTWDEYVLHYRKNFQSNSRFINESEWRVRHIKDHIQYEKIGWADFYYYVSVSCNVAAWLENTYKGLHEVSNKLFYYQSTISQVDFKVVEQ